MLTSRRNLFASRRRFLRLLVLIGSLFAVSAASAQTRTLNAAQVQRLRTLQATAPRPAQIISPSQQPTAASLDAATLTLKRNQFVRIDVPPETKQSPDGRVRRLLPARFTGFITQPGSTTGPQNDSPVELAPYVEPADAALHMSPDGTRYQATIFVGLADEAAPGERRPLTDVSLLLTADGVTITPAAVPINRTNDYTEATLTSATSADSIHLAVHFYREKVTTTLAVVRPTIELEGIPSGLAGLGVGSDEILVRLSPDAGSQVQTVIVSLDPGDADPGKVEVSGTTTATVRIRTAGLPGSAKLSAECGALGKTEKQIPIHFPTAFICSALLGGVLGSLGARLAQLDKSGGSFLRQFIAGVIAGVIGVALYLLGVKVFGANMRVTHDELAVTAVSAVVALGGVGILKSRLFPEKQA